MSGVFIPTPEEKLDALAEHIRLFDELLTGYVSFALMKKHFKAYVNGWDNAKDLRMQLMETATPKDALAALEAGRARLGSV